MNFPYEERYQAEPVVGTGDGEFTAAEIKETGSAYLYHAIHIIDTGANKGKARLALDYDRVDGSFVQFEGGDAGSPLLIYSFRQKGMRFRNGGTVAIPLGSKIIGFARTGATPEFGYVVEWSADISISLTDAQFNTLNGSATTAEILAIRNALADLVESGVKQGQTSRGFVRGPEGAAHTTLANRPEADVIVEFGFE